MSEVQVIYRHLPKRLSSVSEGAISPWLFHLMPFGVADECRDT